jgi:transcriptional regulator GlxA family with amidase domain
LSPPGVFGEMRARLVVARRRRRADDGDMTSHPLLVDIVVFDGVDEIDALGPLEVLRSAAALGTEITARLVTHDERDVVTGAFGLRFEPDAVYVPGEADITIATGGGWATRSDVGAWGEVQRGDWLPLLAETHRHGRVLAAVCTGTMLLAHAGIVGQRRATTHHWSRGDLAATGATVLDDRVVDDGDLVTSGGVTSGLDLALHLLAREVSPDVARIVAERMEYPAPIGVSEVAISAR